MPADPAPSAPTRVVSGSGGAFNAAPALKKPIPDPVLDGATHPQVNMQVAKFVPPVPIPLAPGAPSNFDAAPSEVLFDLTQEAGQPFAEANTANSGPAPDREETGNDQLDGIVLAIKAREESLPDPASFEEGLLRASEMPDFSAAPGPLKTDRRANADISELGRVTALQGDALHRYIAKLVLREFAPDEVSKRLKASNLENLNAAVRTRNGLDIQLITLKNRIALAEYIDRTEGTKKREAPVSSPRHFVHPSRKKQKTVTVNQTKPHGGVDLEYPQLPPTSFTGRKGSYRATPSDDDEPSRTVVRGRRPRSEASRSQLPMSDSSESRSHRKKTRERDYDYDGGDDSMTMTLDMDTATKAELQAANLRNAQYSARREREISQSPVRNFRSRGSQLRDRSARKKKKKKRRGK